MVPYKTSSLSACLHWYQKKLGSYDQQLWEKTVEERVLRGISSAIPKKVTRVKTDLIDLDLIRGSAFSKSKPKHGRVATTCLGILRVLVFPFYFKWWSDQTNSTISSILLILYALQLSSMYIYLNPNDGSDLTTSMFNTSVEELKELDEIPASEVMFPVIMFFILSVIQSHIAASHCLEEKSNYRSTISQESCSPRSVTGNHSTVPDAVTSNNSSNNNNSHVVQRKANVKRKKRSPEKKCLSRKAGSAVTPSSAVDTTDKENEAPNPILESHDDEDEVKRQAATAAAANNIRNSSHSRKPSDEESGLEIPEFCDPKSNTGSNARRRNTMLSKLPISDRKCPDLHTSRQSPASLSHDSRSGNSTGKESSTLKTDDQMTGEEGDHEENEDCADFSSLDEISPYSTVNSESWRRYSDIISQRIRSLSQSRRFSGAEVGILRPRSNTHVRHSRSRFSPAHRSLTVVSDQKHQLHSSSHPDLIISSNDSEASVSPTPLNKANTDDLDWPMLNSEGTSEDDDEEEEAASHSVPVIQSRASVYRDDLTHDDRHAILNGGFYDMDSRCNDGRAERVSCAIWQQFECQKIDLTVVEISSAVIRKAEKARHSNEYLYLAFVVAFVLASIPGFFRLQINSNKVLESAPIGPSLDTSNVSQKQNQQQQPISQSATMELLESLLNQIPVPDPGLIVESLTASNCCFLTRYIVIVAAIQRYCMSVCFFFLLCVAENTYRERFMFAKYFCRLTSARRALGSELPHFRLNKVRNIKTWLSVRSYLKKHGPQRSVDIIVSGGFILAVCILTFLCVQLLRETDTCSSKLYCWEMVSWNLALGIYILRLMVLGIKTNRKYKSNLSVLITEQINLYLQLEQKPHKKEELTLANHVLKLAADLLKQLETPFKISGFSANHYLYNITKVVVLSAFSAVLTEMLGFKLKLHKIKL